MKRDRIIAVGLLAVIISGGTWATYSLIRHPSASHELTHPRADPAVVTPGPDGKIHITFWMLSTKRSHYECYPIIHRDYTDAAGNLVWSFIQEGHMGATNGIPKEIPWPMEFDASKFPPGHYKQWITAFDICPDDEAPPPPAAAPPVTFEVRAR